MCGNILYIFFLSGKVFGIKANYIIAEVEFHEGEDLGEEDMDGQGEQLQEVCD